MWVFALLLGWPLLEIGLFIVVGGAIGLWPTLAMVVLTGALGALLMRWQGLGVLRAVQTQGLGDDPLSPLAHGALILLGGLLLMLPGFFTDFLGLLLMLPPVRRLIIAQLGARIELRGVVRTTADDWVDAEYEEVVPDRDKIGGPSKWSRH